MATARCLCALLLTLGFLLVSVAGGSDKDAVASFHSESNLVLIPTVVHDKSGAHIPNLNQEDLKLLVDGRERPIGIFEEVRPGNQRVQRVKTAPGEFTNILSGQSRPNRLTVIALDTIMTSSFRQTAAREHLLKMLAKSIQEDSMVALVLITTTGTHVIHDFTTDPQVLIEALNNVVGGEPIARTTPSITDQQPIWDFGPDSPGSSGKKDLLQLSRFYLGQFEERSAALERRVAISAEMAALEQIGQALSGIPGRKSLIWVGGGFPFTVSGGEVFGVGLPGDNPGLGSNPDVVRPDVTAQFRMMLPTYERVWRALNDANVAVYAIDARGLTTEGDPASVRLPSPNEQQRQHWLRMDTQDTFRIFAAVTGGEAYTNTNDFEKAYRESMDDAAAYYLLGYYVDRKQDKPGWHELTVKVTRHGADVRSRKGFILRPAEDKAESQQELEVALRAPLDYTGLPVMGRWGGNSGKGEKRKVSFVLRLPAGTGLIDEKSGNHIDLEIYARAQKADGTTVAHSGQEMEGHLTDAVADKAKQEGVRYESALELPPGEYVVHFVIRDKLTGRIGSVSSALKVSEHPAQ